METCEVLFYPIQNKDYRSSYTGPNLIFSPNMCHKQLEGSTITCMYDKIQNKTRKCYYQNKYYNRKHCP